MTFATCSLRPNRKVYDEEQATLDRLPRPPRLLHPHFRLPKQRQVHLARLEEEDLGVRGGGDRVQFSFGRYRKPVFRK